MSQQFLEPINLRRYEPLVPHQPPHDGATVDVVTGRCTRFQLITNLVRAGGLRGCVNIDRVYYEWMHRETVL